MRTISLWNNIPREMVDYSVLDTFKVQLDRVLGHLLFPRRAGSNDG